MARTSIIFGSLLILLGIAAYGIGLSHGRGSFTAFIPAGFGLFLLIPGIIAALKPAATMHAAHVSALFGVIGAAGGLGMSVPKLAKGVELTRPTATYSQLAMGMLCLVFVVLCVRSFIAARRWKKQNG